MKRTKIVCTIGPSSEDPAILKQLMAEGMNVARLNFSHGTHEEQKKKIETLKTLRQELQVPLALALDTKGPEIRLGTFENDAPIELAIGDAFTLTTRDVVGTKEMVHVSYEGLPEDVAPGTRILIDDGLVELQVVSIENGTEIHCQAMNYGVLSNRKGVNVPATNIQLPAMTETDRNDLGWFGCHHAFRRNCRRQISCRGSASDACHR